MKICGRLKLIGVDVKKNKVDAVLDKKLKQVEKMRIDILTALDTKTLLRLKKEFQKLAKDVDDVIELRRVLLSLAKHY